jgi:ankyrin repeat protein
LLLAGADPDAKSRKGNTPLHYAARNNSNPEVTEVLLLAGATLDAKGEGGLTPLALAQKFNESVASLLLYPPSAEESAPVTAKPEE